MIDIEPGKVAIEADVPELPKITGTPENILTISMPDACGFSESLETLDNISSSVTPELGKMPGEFRMAQADCMETYLVNDILPLDLANQEPQKAKQCIAELIKQKDIQLATTLNMKGRDVLNSLRQVPLEKAHDPVNILAEISVLSSIYGNDPNSIKDPNEVLSQLKKSKKQAIESLNGREWQESNIKFPNQDIGSNTKVDVIRHSGFSGLMQYSPEQNAVYVGLAAKPYVESGDFKDLNIAGLHENEHAIYMNLSASQQGLINNAIEQVAKSDPELLKILGDFANELYSMDPNYLKVHAAESIVGLANEDSKPGIKDARVINVHLLDKQTRENSTHQIHMSALITELLSYTTPSQDPSLYGYATSAGKRSAELARIGSKFRQKVDTTPYLKATLQQNGGFLSKRNIPDMSAYL